MSIKFTRTNLQYIDFGTILLTQPKKTFVFTLKLLSSPYDGRLFGKINSALSRGWNSNLDPDQKIQYWQYWSGGADYTGWISTAISVATHRVVIAYDSGAVGNNALCWVDGTSLTMTEVGPVPSGSATENSADPFRIGDLDTGSSWASPNARIEDFRVYGTTLWTASKVAADYADYLAGGIESIQSINEQNLIFHAPLTMCKLLTYPTYIGSTLGSTNVFVDRMAGVSGTPNGSPLGA